MHTPEIRQKFIERRAQGWSLLRIANELGVAKSTLVQWSRQLRFELQNQCALQLDDLQNRLLGPPQQRATALAQRLATVEDSIIRILGTQFPPLPSVKPAQKSLFPPSLLWFTTQSVQPLAGI